MEKSGNRFVYFFLGSWGSFAFFAILAYGFGLYRVAPFLGLIGYTTMIFLLLAALYQSYKNVHYILVSGSLMLFGAIASFDLISSKDELTNLWRSWLGGDLSEATADGIVQSLTILLSIFCGSLASATLFYGLNKKNFPK
ncbi:MAG: hypothetical protein AAGJ81_15675 [Verrucomicrobiota bacterium]